MSASKDRPRWSDLPDLVRRQIECLLGGTVIGAQNCEGGFSPGFASRLTLASGTRAFVKAIDAAAWPTQAPIYRDEARIAVGLSAAMAADAALAESVPVPRFLGWRDDGSFVILAFECVAGHEPARPWRAAELAQVATAVCRMSAALTPSPLAVSGDQPRVGGWAEFSNDPMATAQLAAVSPWAARHLHRLILAERHGLVAAKGTALVHFDALPHNILLTGTQVLLVDWPHARLGAPVIDLLMVLASAAADGIDPDPVLRAQPITDVTDTDVTAVLAALTGFWLAGALQPMPPGLGPIAAAKLHLGRGALWWLQRRLAATSTASSPRSC
jgi:Phosphotransferase enzyme family